MSNHRKAADALPEAVSDKVTEAGPEGCSPIMPQHNQTTGLEKRLPTEVWEWIFKYLYPSQLSRVSMVCRTFYDIVAKLHIWTEIYAKAHPDNQNHVVGGIKPVLGDNPIKDFMLHICAESLRICELCFLTYNGTDMSWDRLAYLTLPVHVWRVRLATKKTDAFRPFRIEIGPQDWVIRLCLNCRREIFRECPESLPIFLKRREIGCDLMEAYNLEYSDVRGIRVTDLNNEERVLVRAREKFGGDVGVEASSKGSSSNAVKSMISRLKEVNLSWTRDEVDA
ncbi:MAG: hypothetical protein J3Q66DRAFT_321238 [Benniella sp.]|nr:MAG: hypothetical protein J3Q66DRAFT_321238 [Benniella sp.]